MRIFPQALNHPWKLKVLVAQWCSTLCNPLNCSLTDSSVHEILQEKNTEVGFSSPGDLPDPGIKPRSPALLADSSVSEPSGKPLNHLSITYNIKLKLYKQLPVWNKFKFWFWEIYGFFKNIFDPRLTESADVEAADEEGRLYVCYAASHNLMTLLTLYISISHKQNFPFNKF